MWQLCIETFFDWWEIQFEQVWSSLIHFGQIWSKKIQNKIAIFILFWLERNLIWSSFEIKKRSNFFYLFLTVTTFFGFLQPLGSCCFQTDVDTNTDIQVKIVSRLDILFDHADLSQNNFFNSFYRLIDLILSWRENLQQRLMTLKVLWN